MASDERLVEHVRDGSEAAFEQLYDRHHRGILGFCRHMLGSAEEAEDAVQHTFMAAYRDLVGSGKPIHLRPWLYTIARNRCYSTLRARRERPLGEADEPATENLSSEVQRRQDLRDLLSDLSGLPDDQRAALVLAELGAVSHDEIATVLEVPREKVKALVFQARTSLMASRQARDTPCTEIREQLASLRGGSLRRTTLRRHLRECPGCRAFRNEVAMQRRALAVALPVLPTLGLKHTALAAAFGSGSAGGGAAAAAAGAGAGAAVSTATGGGGALAAKALVAVALVGGGTTAGLTATRDAHPGHRPPARTAHDATAGARATRPHSAAVGTPRAAAVPVAAERRHGGPSTAERAGSPGGAHRQTATAKRKHDAASHRHKQSPSRQHQTGAGNGKAEQHGGPGSGQSGNANGHSGTGKGHNGNGNGGGSAERGTGGKHALRPANHPAPELAKPHGGDDAKPEHVQIAPAPVPTTAPAPVPTAEPTAEPTAGSGEPKNGGNSGHGGSNPK